MIQDALSIACEYVRKLRADMGGTNILAPLTWILRQPVASGHPRLLFLLTDGAVSNTGKIIELVRSHARYIRQVLMLTAFLGISSILFCSNLCCKSCSGFQTYYTNSLLMLNTLYCDKFITWLWLICR